MKGAWTFLSFQVYPTEKNIQQPNIFINDDHHSRVFKRQTMLFHHVIVDRESYFLQLIPILAVIC